MLILQYSCYGKNGAVMVQHKCELIYTKLLVFLVALISSRLPTSPTRQVKVDNYIYKCQHQLSIWSLVFCACKLFIGSNLFLHTLSLQNNISISRSSVFSWLTKLNIFISKLSILTLKCGKPVFFYELGVMWPSFRKSWKNLEKVKTIFFLLVSKEHIEFISFTPKSVITFVVTICEWL